MLDHTLRPIPDAPGYFAGSDGRIYSTKRGAPHALKPRPHHRTGHLRVRLYTPDAELRACGGSNRSGSRARARYIDAYVHVLVCIAWHGPPPFEGGALVLHSDDVPTHNTPGNLRWGTHADNAADAKRNAEGEHRRGMQLDSGPGSTCSEWGF